MSTTDYDEYFLNGPASGVGGGGGGGVAAGSGGLRFTRGGRTVVNTPLRFSGGGQMQFTTRAYVCFTRFSFQDFFWHGNTDDGTNIGLEIRQTREINNVQTIIQAETIDLPSYNQNLKYSGSLTTPFNIEPEDSIFVRIVASPSGATAADVNNCAIQFKVEA
jgi:hypothetical protein